ncbi:tRNA dihydrouridine synthase [Coemansia biformis]|uniref:tRNA-dihydrouridine(16/17) synthase [NAD(P)(+)] n=1 Tax=Coemansia biformis TaxID=1286918 RepID=A0A9W8CZK1_9FUNG|nr:tRNA dihydrouridine synthase [Coemansia biformis]
MTVPTGPAERPAHFTMTEDEVMAKFPARARGFELLHKLGNPKHVVAPMVDQSELAWRTLSRRYDAHLCYTPMFHAKSFADEKAKYFHEQWQTDGEDRPLVVQFCANDPDILLNAAKRIEHMADAVDINLGCPQHIARRGRYGSFLMDDWDLVSRLIRRLHEALAIPVTAKIRVFPDVAKTVAYARIVEAAGAQIITVHGRLREQKGHKTGLADWAQIKAVKDAVSVPVFANGNILYFEDIQRCLDATTADGVMSAETNLYNPAIFSGKVLPTWQLAQEYMEICREIPTNQSYIRGHLFKLFRYSLPIHTDLRQRLVEARTMDEFAGCVEAIKVRLMADAAAQSSPFDLDAFEVDEFGYRKYPHWICQPALRFEHDKEHSKSKRLLNEAQADPKPAASTAEQTTEAADSEANAGGSAEDDAADCSTKRQKTAAT